MNKIGLGLDFSNICQDYNTAFLDRDNDDPATVACMRKVLKWFDAFLSDLQADFDYKIYRMNQNNPLALKEIVQNRFFFYSLEKEMIMQTFVMQKKAVSYNSLEHWAKEAKDSLLIQNDDEGEGVYFYVEKDSNIHQWLLDKLADLSLDEIPFPEV